MLLCYSSPGFLRQHSHKKFPIFLQNEYMLRGNPYANNALSKVLQYFKSSTIFLWKWFLEHSSCKTHSLYFAKKEINTNGEHRPVSWSNFPVLL